LRVIAALHEIGADLLPLDAASATTLAAEDAAARKAEAEAEAAPPAAHGTMEGDLFDG
jgi:hypothetical protein